MLLEELAKKETLRIDFHNHGQTGDEFRQKPKGLWNKLKYLLVMEGFRDLSGLLERTADSGLDVCYLTDTVAPNFSNQRFANWTNEEQIQKAVEAGWEIEVGKYYVFAAKGEGEERKVIALGHSVEFEPKETHFIAAGVKRKARYEFREKFSVKQALEKLTDGELTSGEKYHEKLESVQVDANFYLPFSLRGWKAKKAGRRKGVPVTYNNDGHHPKDIGNTYNIFDSEDLDYSSEKTFRDSINDSVRNKNFGHHYSPVPPWRIFHHILMMVTNKIFHLYK